MGYSTFNNVTQCVKRSETVAYRNSYNYKGGARKSRENKRVEKNLRRIGWILLWLFVGMLITHLIYSVAVKTKQTVGELSSAGIPPIVTIQDEANAEGSEYYYIGESLSDPYETDAYIAMLIKKGIKRVVLEIKPESGALTYASISKTAQRLGAAAEGAPQADKLILKFANAGIDVIARMSLYCDGVAATAEPKKAAVIAESVETTVTDEEGNVIPAAEIRPTDTVWLDNSGYGWLNPYENFAAEYVKELMEELANAGVKAVIINNVTFPTVSDGANELVTFRGEESSELPRAGAVRQNVSVLYSTAQSLGVELYAELDAAYCCGAQDERAGITFNVFELSADAICPDIRFSQMEKEGVASVGDYTFDTTVSADLTQLMNALAKSAKIMQGALHTPPRIMPLVQVYTDTSLPSGRRRDISAEDVAAMRSALDSNLILGRVFFGTRDSYASVFPDLA